MHLINTLLNFILAVTLLTTLIYATYPLSSFLTYLISNALGLANEHIFLTYVWPNSIGIVRLRQPPNINLLPWTLLQSVYPHELSPIWGSSSRSRRKTQPNMMTSSNGSIFRVTGHLCGEFTGPRWIPHTKASDAQLWCLLWSVPE